MGGGWVRVTNQGRGSSGWRGVRIVSPGGSSIFYGAAQTNETRATRNKGWGAPLDTSKGSPMGGFSLKLGRHQPPTHVHKPPNLMLRH